MPLSRAEQQSSELTRVAEDQRQSLSLYLTFRSVNKKLQTIVARNLKTYDFTDAQFGVLRAFEHKTRCNMGDILPWVFIGNTGVTRVIDRMENKGLVKRIKEGLSDGRERHVVLTEKGRDLLNKVLPAHRRYVASLASAMKDEEVQLLEELLRKFENLLEQELVRTAAVK